MNRMTWSRSTHELALVIPGNTKITFVIAPTIDAAHEMIESDGATITVVP